MRRVLAGALIGAFAAMPAFAQMTDVDTDGDGMASFEELVAAYPDVTEDQFGSMDADGDGFLNEDEMAAAVESGELSVDE